MTADPLSFLHAALDAAQARAEAAGGDEWTPQDHPADTVAIYDSEREPVVYDESLPTPAQIVHIVANDPAAVLRRIAADRKLIAEHPHTTRVINPTCGLPPAGFGCDNCHNWDGVPEGRGYCDTILALAEGWGWTGETT